VGTDPGRFLDRNPANPPTSNPSRAVPGEPEMVDVKTEQRFSLAARRHAEEKRRDAWNAAHGQIDRALEQFEREAHPDRKTSSDTRVIRRAARRITDRLNAD
jgi:hypothetical protein